MGRPVVYLFLILTLTLSQVLFCNEEIKLTEENLAKLVEDHDIVSQEKNVQIEQSKNNSAYYLDKYASFLTSFTEYEQTNELAITPVSPIFTPVSRLGINYTKNYSNGLSAEVSFYDQFMNVKVLNSKFQINLVQAYTKMKVDLWKNFLGYRDKLEIKQLDLLREMQEIDYKKIKHISWIRLKRMYYELLGLQEKRKLANKLFIQAKKQTRIIKNKLKYGAADKGVLSRYKAQENSRKSLLYMLEIQENDVKRRFKQHFKNFDQIDISLAPYDKMIKIIKAQKCLARIKNEKNIPLDKSYIHDYLLLKHKSVENQNSQDNLYDSIDLRFEMQLGTKGYGKTLSQSYDQGFLHNRASQKVGLYLTLPLGDQDQNKKRKIVLRKSAYELEKEKLFQSLKTMHEYSLQALNSLLMLIENSKEQSNSLETSMSYQAKKFAQGRITASSYIMEQDNLLESQLNYLDNQIQVIFALLSYLEVFQKFPCDINVM